MKRNGSDIGNQTKINGVDGNEKNIGNSTVSAKDNKNKNEKEPLNAGKKSELRN